MDFNIEKLEKQFHADGYQLGMKSLEKGVTKNTLLIAVSNLYNLIDEVLKYFNNFAKKQNQSPDCYKGCSWCCSQPVFALSYELEYLVSYITTKFESTTREKIIKRAREKRDKLKGIGGKALLNSKIQCPLLFDNACIAYPARPVACRIYLSTDRQSCIRFFEKPECNDSIPALYNFPMRIGRMINEGFKAAFKIRGLRIDEYRIDERLSV